MLFKKIFSSHCDLQDFIGVQLNGNDNVKKKEILRSVVIHAMQKFSYCLIMSHKNYLISRTVKKNIVSKFVDIHYCWAVVSVSSVMECCLWWVKVVCD